MESLRSRLPGCVDVVTSPRYMRCVSDGAVATYYRNGKLKLTAHTAERLQSLTDALEDEFVRGPSATSKPGGAAKLGT